jgi:pimeloyl-ACP methyl ester carboxylesterase
MGISLGGMGALEYIRKRPQDISGAVLLAPFLGTRGLIAEIVRAGGLDQWCPGSIEAGDEERRLAAWLKNWRVDDTHFPLIHLGYGMSDRFAPASRLISQRLAPQQVITEPGGHDWPTWLALWSRMLDQVMFTAGE